VKRALLALALLATTAHAEPLRMATVAPDGSSWGNALRAFAREVDSATAGRVRIKWYMNAVAGEEEEMTRRLKQGQLDGVASGGVVCSQVMPSWRVLSVPALFQDHDEALHVVNALTNQLDAEAHQNGFALIGGVSLGVEMLFARAPLRSLAELRKLRTWHWSADDVGAQMTNEMGIPVVLSGLGDAAKLYQDGKIDAFWAIPTTALVFQWSLLAPYLHELTNNFRVGCIVISARVIDAMSADDRRQLYAATAHVRERFDEMVRKTDDQLLHGAFQHQGVHIVPLSETFRTEYFNAANSARDRKAAALVGQELVAQVRRLLADWRAEHRR
jgi:TRAP-type C4-dicarboxylate transport system substrate-binding protein